MSTAERTLTITLFVSAAIAVLVGLATIVIGHTITRNRVAASNELLEENLETAERVAHAVATHSDQLQVIAELPPEAADAAERLPPALEASIDATRQANLVLRQTAGLVRTVGVDFVAPGSPFENTATATEDFAEQLSRLRKVALESRQPVGTLVDQTAQAAAAVRTLTQALAEAGIDPKLVERRLERTLALQERTDVAAAAAWQQTAFGGGFIFIGILLAGVGAVWRRLARSDRAQSLPSSES